MEITESVLVDMRTEWTNERAALIDKVRTFDGAIQAVNVLLDKLKETAPVVDADVVKDAPPE